MRILTIVGAFLVSLGLLIVLLLAADLVWTVIAHGHLGADRVLWGMGALALIAAGAGLLALSARRRFPKPDR